MITQHFSLKKKKEKRWIRFLRFQLHYLYWPSLKQKFKLWKVFYNHHFIVIHRFRSYSSRLYKQLQNTNPPHIYYFNLFFRSFRPEFLQQPPQHVYSLFFLFFIFKLQKIHLPHLKFYMPAYIYLYCFTHMHKCFCLNIDRRCLISVLLYNQLANRK